MKYDVESIKKRKQYTKNIKKIVDVILVILIYNIILVAISCINKIEPINIFGCRAYIIKTNSMEPDISIGDIIITRKTSEEELNKGDVITFRRNGEVITHRIVNIEETENGKKYITKGDNNNVEDLEKITYEEIEGKKFITIPYLGKFIMFIENQIIFFIIVLVLLILYFYKIQLQEKKENRREKKKIEQSKKAEN